MSLQHRCLRLGDRHVGRHANIMIDRHDVDTNSDVTVFILHVLWTTIDELRMRLLGERLDVAWRWRGSADFFTKSCNDIFKPTLPLRRPYCIHVHDIMLKGWSNRILSLGPLLRRHDGQRLSSNKKQSATALEQKTASTHDVIM